MKSVIQGMRREDGPSGDRKLSLPMGNGHLVKLADPNCHFDTSSSTFACTRWALLHTMLHCLMRGGEPGTCSVNSAFDPKTGLCWSHFKWMDLASGLTATITDKNGLIYFVLTILVYAIKDVNATHKRVPIQIRSKHPTSYGLRDIKCPYTAIWRSWCQRLDQEDVTAKNLEPFFTNAQGEALDTDTIRAFIREAAAALSLNPELFGSSALRRGGATDLRDVLGSHAAKELIKQRGRWATDIYDIYARASTREHAEASAAIGRADALTLETSNPGWTQPTRF